MVKPTAEEGKYDIYPVFPLQEGLIPAGFNSLATRLAKERMVILDGYQGIFFDLIRSQLDACFRAAGLRVAWHDAGKALLPAAETERLITPFLGGDDPLFGTRTNLKLADFFDQNILKEIHPDPAADLNILYGTGAALAGWKGCLVYFDLPKNEMQYRAREGAITNLGAAKPGPAKAMYKQFYFVDWVVLNRHKEAIYDRVDVLCDGQRPEEVTWLEGIDFRAALTVMSRGVFRVRPWFEPGAWGGNWIKEHIPGLPGDVPNYAWSFEMIVPENGIILESSRKMLEASFDWLMYGHSKEILGNCHPRFQTEFPIRFDFLDTFGGGNLSVQCHPREDYIRNRFGENFTQQEAYYILDTKEDALVNLGFRDNVDPDKFRQELEKSATEKTPVDIPVFIQQHPSHRHDLFLIPDGTVHGSGINNLVLEISTTPYIFTFKMYDWLRLDLDGNPRDLNIRRAFDNLDFNIKGDRVKEEFISRPTLIAEGNDWTHYHLPTHPRHYYDVWRFHFRSEITIPTGNDCHVLSLVKGRQIIVKIENSPAMTFNYAETFVVAAAAGSYKVINTDEDEAMLVVAFMKSVR
ncbi:MAG: class I mannose-6-phosphate isomerase [Bacteroidetes bacterium]|nr:class I mannose-6-phosphate isomerase [Bacteroidota bacterium]